MKQSQQLPMTFYPRMFDNNNKIGFTSNYFVPTDYGTNNLYGAKGRAASNAPLLTRPKFK